MQQVLVNLWHIPTRLHGITLKPHEEFHKKKEQFTYPSVLSTAPKGPLTQQNQPFHPSNTSYILVFFLS